MWDEAELIIDRTNGLEATRAILTQLAVSSILSKDAGKLFAEHVRKLSGSEEQTAKKYNGEEFLARLNNGKTK